MRDLETDYKLYRGEKLTPANGAGGGDSEKVNTRRGNKEIRLSRIRNTSRRMSRK